MGPEKKSVVDNRCESTVAAGGNSKAKVAKGLSFSRLNSRPGINPLDEVTYVERSSVIRDPDGSEIFRMDEVEVPVDWSQLATDVVVSKYFRKAGVPETGSEVSVRQLVHRVSKTLREGGEWLGGYFRTEEDADIFEAELAHLLVRQKAAFNSPVWFNLGLFQRYGIEGSGGTWAWDFNRGEPLATSNAYARPLCSACFIQSVDDDLMSIFQLVQNEARLFKYGSGTGTNFSSLRSRYEKLSGGGTSSGLMSFLEVLDRGAGATKSGGTTRRAAKMVCVDADHPEILDFVRWKAKEEEKARALIAAGWPADFNGEAYRTVGGQNANNSVRVSDEFMEAALSGGSWETRQRTDGTVHSTLQASDLLDEISRAAWQCADPGLQYHSTINRWHTCSNTAPIRASNPCSEFMFLDDSACNLASINLLKYVDQDGTFRVAEFEHAVRVLITAQDILVDFSSYPTRDIAANSHRFRPLGLGYAGLGAVLMGRGVPYDSEEGRGLCAAVTSLMTGRAYEVSAEMAGEKGAFEGYAVNAEPFSRVMRQHQAAASKIPAGFCPDELRQAAVACWDRAVKLGGQKGYRNSQTTVLAPTGTIGLLMDCETTGIEPDFALVKFKKLAGGGHFKIVNQSLNRALTTLGYSSGQIDDIITHICGTLTLAGEGPVNVRDLLDAGLSREAVDRVEAALATVFHLSQAFSSHVVGLEALEELGVPEEKLQSDGFQLLNWLGYSEAQVHAANRRICGRLTIEGAPHIRDEHLAVFDCASRCGETGVRLLSPMAHIGMMAAAQPFLSGAISKTVNLPHECTVEEIKQIYIDSWRLGIKALAIYRDGCKGSQPLSATSGAAAVAAGEEVVNGTSPVGDMDAMPLHRYRLPKKRSGFTQEAQVGGQKVYLRTGQYEDGSLGEIFLDMHKEGAALRSMMNCFAIAISLGLQYGVPLKEYVDCFTFTKFEPQGVVNGHPNIKWSTSVIDYIFRVLGYEYLGLTEFLQVQPDEDADDGGARPSPPTARVRGAARAADQARGSGTKRRGAFTEYLARVAGDAPFCNQCGHITVRNGACYKCLNCGNSMGCS
jgi:ribonucleoside-diphosphate reductase alpha chain